MRKLDPTTFGDSKAAIVLADLLSQEINVPFRRNVSRHWHHYKNIMNDIWSSDMKQQTCFRLAADFHMAKRLVVKDTNWPSKLKTYLLNIMMAELKKQHRRKLK